MKSLHMCCPFGKSINSTGISHNAKLNVGFFTWNISLRDYAMTIKDEFSSKLFFFLPTKLSVYLCSAISPSQAQGLLL